MVAVGGRQWPSVPVSGRRYRAGMSPRAPASESEVPADGPPSSVEPLHLVSGPEDLLAERAISGVLAAARALDPQVQVIDVRPDTYSAGDLVLHTSPSLFGEGRVVVLWGLDDARDELITDARALLASPEPDVVVVLRHRGGSRGKALVDAAKSAKAVVHSCAAVKTDSDKNDFVTREFRAARRRIAPDAVRALVRAVGQDLRELASACSQLMADTVPPLGSATSAPPIDVSVVEQYYGGRVEASGFKVADAAIAGQTDEALGLLRHALATGMDPVPIIAVLAMGLRSLAKVSASGAGPSTAAAKELGMAPWQVDRARRELGSWTEAGISAAIEAVAAADLAVKGGLPSPTKRAGDPVYAVEKAVLTIGAVRGRRA